jgi:hypothetical protein
MCRPPPARTLSAMTVPTQREQEMTVASLRAACATGLVLVALLAISSPAAARGPEHAYRGSSSAVVAGARGGFEVVLEAAVQCPCNPDLPRSGAAGVPIIPVSAVQCPCNPDLPRASSPSTELRSGGGQIRGGLTTGSPEPAIARSVPLSAPREGFDWTDAGVGAGAAAGIGLLLAATTRALSRRRLHGQVRA